MGILDQLASATGDKASNEQLVKSCLQTPALLHSVAEGLRTGTSKACVDCAEILVEVAKRRPELLANFVGDFIDASQSFRSKGGSRKVAKLGFSGLGLVAHAQPAEVFAARDYLAEVAALDNPLGLAAASVLGTLCHHNPNYRGKLLGQILRRLQSVPAKDLSKWLKAFGPAFEGSQDGLKRLQQTLKPTLDQLPDEAKKRLDRQLTKLLRSVKSRKG